MEKKPDGKIERECLGLDGSHEYSEENCPECGAVFCFSCCLDTNVHQGGKYDEDFMLCPCCGVNVFGYVEE